MPPKKNDPFKSFGLQLIRATFVGILTVNFVLLPLLVLSLLIFVVRYNSFGSGLLMYIFIVYLAGGFIFLTAKFWEFWDDQYILHMRAKWKSNPLMKNIHFKVVVPENFEKTPGEMYSFYAELWALNAGLRTNYEVYAMGKWYYDFSFDIIIRQKKVEMYFTGVLKRKDFFIKAFHNRYPEIKLVECEDPYKNWPKEWVEGKGVPGYKNFHGWDYKPLAPDMYPIGNPEKLQNNPLGELIDTLKNYDPNATIILQYNFRPYANVHSDRWWKELEQAKSEELGKSAAFQVKDIETGKMRTATTGDLVTQAQKDVYDEVAAKISDLQIRAHLRFMLFYPEGKDYYNTIYQRFLKTYAGQTAGANQIIGKNWYTATDRFFIASDTPVFDNILGPILNRLYHPKEVEWRRKCLYSGLLARDVDISQDSMEFMLSVANMGTLLHFPTNFGIFTEEINSNPEPPQNQGQPINQSSDPQPFSKLQELRQKTVAQNQQ